MNHAQKEPQLLHGGAWPLAADVDEHLIRDEAALIERFRKGEKDLVHELI